MATSVLETNGNYDNPALSPDVVKILVVGEPLCGKTRFIETFYEANDPERTYTYLGFRYYILKYPHADETLKTIAICENVRVAADHLRKETLDRHMDAHGVVFTYAIDNPTSYERLISQWITDLSEFAKKPQIAKIAVGLKRDLRANQQVIQRLALENRAPVSLEEGEMLAQLEEVDKYFECVTDDLQQVGDAFKYVLEDTLGVLFPVYGSM